MRSNLKQNAIKLRQQGFSYNEILAKIPVAKSTLSLWLRSVGLSKRQKQRLTEKKLTSLKKGWQTWRKTRIENTKLIIENAKSEIKNMKINNQSLLIIGSILYWAEGAKEKPYRPGQGIIFSNSDPKMATIFILWLKKCLNVSDKDIFCEIYIHENYKDKLQRTRAYWSKNTGLSISKFGRIYFKKHLLKTSRRNIGDEYYGLLRVRVSKSSHLNRKITGWIEGICEQCGVV